MNPGYSGSRQGLAALRTPAPNGPSPASRPPRSISATGVGRALRAALSREIVDLAGVLVSVEVDDLAVRPDDDDVDRGRAEHGIPELGDEGTGVLCISDRVGEREPVLLAVPGQCLGGLR